MTKIYHCIKDKNMEDFRNKDPANGYAYHVTNIDCCGRTKLNMKKINWIRNRVDERVESIKSILSGESQPNQPNQPNQQDMTGLADQLAAINLNEDLELRPFEIRKSNYHPAVEGVEGVFMNTTLYDGHLPDWTVYPFGKPQCQVDHYYQRISIKFDKISEKYPQCKFWCIKDKQRHYICYKSESKIKNFNKTKSATAGIKFSEDFQDSELEVMGIKKEGATKDILPYLQNDYKKEEYFNNLVLLGGIEILGDAIIDIAHKFNCKS